MPPIIQIQDVSKQYHDNIQALKEINLEIAEGEFFALLGPNGAGKSTLIHILTSLVLKSSGQIRVGGVDLDDNVHRVRQQLGLVPQEFNFNLFEKCLDILIQQAGYYGVPKKIAYERSEYYLKRLNLWGVRHTAARHLSGGMKRRLIIARALIHEPPILIFDEPTAGVDVELRQEIWTLLQELNQSGKTIILTTHYLEEAEKLCRHVAIINHGSVIVDSTIKALVASLPKITYALEVDEAVTLDVSKFDNGFSILKKTAGTFEITLDRGSDFNGLIDVFNRQGVSIKSIRSISNPLESVFLHYTKETK